MDTSRDYYEDKIADYNRYRRGRNLYQFCKDEGIDYNWMLRAQRQFGGKGNKKKNTVHDEDKELIQLHFEDDTDPAKPTAGCSTDGMREAQAETAGPECWKVSDVKLTDPDGNEITLRCGSIHVLGRI